MPQAKVGVIWGHRPLRYRRADRRPRSQRRNRVRQPPRCHHRRETRL